MISACFALRVSPLIFFVVSLCFSQTATALISSAGRQFMVLPLTSNPPLPRPMVPAPTSSMAATPAMVASQLPSSASVGILSICRTTTYAIGARETTRATTSSSRPSSWIVTVPFRLVGSAARFVAPARLDLPILDTPSALAVASPCHRCKLQLGRPTGLIWS